MTLRVAKGKKEKRIKSREMEFSEIISYDRPVDRRALTG